MYVLFFSVLIGNFLHHKLIKITWYITSRTSRYDVIRYCISIFRSWNMVYLNYKYVRIKHDVLKRCVNLFVNVCLRAWALSFWLLTSFLVAKLLYKSKFPSVCQPRLGENVIFSAPNCDIAPIFFVHLFCKYFVRLSVGNATKALLLIDVSILV